MARGRVREAGSNLAAVLCQISRSGWASISRSKTQAAMDSRRAYSHGWMADSGRALRTFKAKGWVGRVKGGRYFLTRRGAKAARIACELLPRVRRKG